MDSDRITFDSKIALRTSRFVDGSSAKYMLLDSMFSAKIASSILAPSGLSDPIPPRTHLCDLIYKNWCEEKIHTGDMRRYYIRQSSGLSTSRFCNNVLAEYLTFLRDYFSEYYCKICRHPLR